MNTVTVTSRVHFGRRGHGGAKQLRMGPEPALVPPGRLPRVTRLMALAIRFDGLVRTGAVADYATLARLGHVTRARITQIMNLTLLAPTIQEAILFLPRLESGRATIVLRDLLHIAAEVNWKRQRELWCELRQKRGISE